MPRERRILIACTVAAVMTHALIAGAINSRGFFYLSVGTAQRAFGRSVGEESLYDDVEAYRAYGSPGRGWPYRDFDVEYPLLALPLFVLPGLFSRLSPNYKLAFAVEMLLFDAWAVWLVLRRTGERSGVRGAARALTWYTLALAALGPIPFARFDLAAMAIGFAAARGLAGGRAAFGGMLAGVGALVKLFPAVVIIPTLARDRPARRRCVAAFAATVGLGAIAWAGLGGRGVVRALAYHAGRGLEIESLYAGLYLLAAPILGLRPETDFNHSSVQLLGPGTSALATLAAPIQVGALLLVLGRSRPARDDGLRWSAAAIVAFAASGKVLSPQYLLWPLPFIVTLDGRVGRLARPLYLAACVATLLVYPWSAGGLAGFHPLAVAILNARNALLVALFAALTFAPEEPPTG